MKNSLFVVALILTSSLPAASVEAIYTTSTGAVFTRVKITGFGQAWMDPSGTLWSDYLGLFSNEALSPDQNGVIVESPATRACARIGGKLPSVQDWQNLTTYFDRIPHGSLTEKGISDFGGVFSDKKYSNLSLTFKLNYMWFLTSTPKADSPGDAYVYNHSVENFPWMARDGIGAARCVRIKSTSP